MTEGPAAKKALKKNRKNLGGGGGRPRKTHHAVGHRPGTQKPNIKNPGATAKGGKKTYWWKHPKKQKLCKDGGKKRAETQTDEFSGPTFGKLTRRKKKTHGKKNQGVEGGQKGTAPYKGSWGKVIQGKTE